MANVRTLVIVIVFLFNFVGQNFGQALSNASRKFTELLKNYDKRVRPGADEDIPVNVKMQISISDLGPINEKSFTFRVDLYFRNWWRDPRLRIGIGNLTFNGIPKEIWIPDLYVKNARQIQMLSAMAETIRTSVYYDGSVYTSARISSVCTCKMNLRAYPLDRQVCEMVMESYAFGDSSMQLDWHETSVEYTKKNLEVEGYELKKISSYKKVMDYIIGENYTNMVVRFYIERTFSYYLFRSYIPSTFLVLMTWGSFWLPMTTYPARTALIVTNFLASAFILQGASNHITKVPYSTAIEVFLLANIMFILATMLEYIAVIQASSCNLKVCGVKENENAIELLPSNNNRPSRGSNREKKADVHCIDRASRIIFPLAYLIFITAYFTFYINFESK